MKLLLVNPNFNGKVFAPSLGLGFIGTHVKDNSNWDVEIVEPTLQGVTEKQVLERAATSAIVGLVSYTESRFECFRFAERVKALNHKCTIIVGGPHVNTLDRLIMHNYPSIDAVIRMEGEETTLDIVRGKPFDQIPGITWRDESNVVRNPDRVMRQNIDRYHYDYSLSFSCLEGWKDLEVPDELQKLTSIPIIASRGCPYRCTFCASYNQWAGSYRGLSPEELVRRMEDLVNRYSVGYFRFYDALFVGSDERVLKFCDLLEMRKLNIHFRIDIRVGTSETVLRRLREVGCDVVGFGVESGSNRILKKVNKGITREQTEETIRLCKKLGFWIIGFFMISLPGENIEDAKKTFELFEYFDRLNVQFFKIHPNTAIYDALIRGKEIYDGIWFDPEQGDQTEYGNEFYYCRENFPGAFFSMNEGNLLIESSIYRYHLANPRALFHSTSFPMGILTLLTSFIMEVLLKKMKFQKLYMKFKKTSTFNSLKRIYKQI